MGNTIPLTENGKVVGFMTTDPKFKAAADLLPGRVFSIGGIKIAEFLHVSPPARPDLEAGGG